MSTEQFQHALSKLVNDESYRNALKGNPNKLVEDYSLSEDEIGTLASVWKQCEGSDVEGYMDIVVACCCCCP